MKITEVQTFTVRVPNHPNSWNSAVYGPPGWDVPPVIIIKVLADTGIHGLGEVNRGVPLSTVEAYTAELIGQDPLEMNLKALPIGDSWDRGGPCYHAIEMAILDLVGKHHGMPVYKLLGGAYRKRVLVSTCSGEMTTEDTVALARRAVERGYRYIKFKAYGHAPVVERIAAINAAVGDQIKVVIDGNGRLGLPAVLDDICERLGDYRDNVQLFEDPFDPDNLDWYVMMRQKIHFPLALHLNYGRRVIEAIKREACDYLNLGGSAFQFMQAAGIAATADIPFWHGSSVGFGISEAALVHSCAAAEYCTLSSDIVGELVRSNDLIVEPLEFKDGHVTVPEAPGLGVELDMAAVEKYGVK